MSKDTEEARTCSSFYRHLLEGSQGVPPPRQDLNRILVALVALFALAARLMASAPGPDVAVAHEPVTGDAHFGGATHFHITLTFTDPNGVQHASYRDPDAEEFVNLGGACTNPFTRTVFHKNAVSEAHAADCEKPLPHNSHWFFLSSTAGPRDEEGNVTVKIVVPKKDATVTKTEIPPGWGVFTSTSPGPGDLETTVTLKIKPGALPGIVRVSVDPHGDTFIYEIELQSVDLDIPLLSPLGLVLLALLLAGAATLALNGKTSASVFARRSPS
jgi:hypothetical protein